MATRVLIFGVVTGVFITALLAILSVVDLITTDQLLDSLGKVLLVVAISTGAIVAMLAIARLGRPQVPDSRPPELPPEE